MKHHPQGLSPEQVAFEDAAFNKRFTAGIHLNPNPRAMGTDRLIPDDCPTQEEFCAKTEDGAYVQYDLNPAWWAWRARGKFEREAPRCIRPEGCLCGGDLADARITCAYWERPHRG